MIRRVRLLKIVLAMLLLCTSAQACSGQARAAQQQVAASLKGDLARVQAEIAQASRDTADLGEGLLKALIAVRLEVLKTNAALVEQRIHVIEGAVRTRTVAVITRPDSQRATALAREIEAQRAKIEEARREADRYSGGLVQAMALTTLATSRSTLAMLQQQHLMARYGMALPALPTIAQTGSAPSESSPTPATRAATRSAQPTASEPASCLKIQDYDSSVLSSNDVFTELAWKIDVVNACDRAFNVRALFAIYDKDEFELDNDSEDVYVPAKGVGKARGKMLVNPPEKAARMAKQGASISPR